MNGPETKRRRWLWLLSAIGIAAIGGSLAWTFRPLNAAERRLLGTWTRMDDERVRFRFTADRRVQATVIKTLQLEDYGDWHAADGSVVIRCTRVKNSATSAIRSVAESPEAYLGRSHSLRFEGDDRAIIKSHPYRRSAD